MAWKDGFPGEISARGGGKGGILGNKLNHATLEVVESFLHGYYSKAFIWHCMESGYWRIFGWAYVGIYHSETIIKKYYMTVMNS